MRRFAKVGKGAAVRVTVPQASSSGGSSSSSSSSDSGDAVAVGGSKGAVGLLGLEIRPEPMNLTYVGWRVERSEGHTCLSLNTHAHLPQNQTNPPQDPTRGRVAHRGEQGAPRGGAALRERGDGDAATRGGAPLDGGGKRGADPREPDAGE